ncbi:MAG: hypothetical protein ABFS12_02895 [Bacteroidota bacterium]
MQFGVTAIAQESDESSYNYSIGMKYLSRFVAYGIDLADDNTAWGINTSLGHSSGFYVDGYYTKPITNQLDLQQWGVDIGYEKEFFSGFNMYMEYSHFEFATDTANILSQFTNSLSVNTEFDLAIFDLGLSYDHYFGEPGASYFGIDISTFYDLGPFYIMPMAQAVFMSQTIENSYLSKGKTKKKNDPIVEVTEVIGLANTMLTLVTICPIIDNVSLSVVPALIFNNQSELSNESTQFVWNAGLRYNLSF